MPHDEASPTSPIQALPAAAASRAAQLPNMRNVSQSATTNPNASVGSIPMSRSESTLSYRKSNPSAASLYASTLSPPGSRSMSPAGRGSPSKMLGTGIFDAPADREITDSAADNPGDPINLILRAFVPHVSIYTSKDVDTMMSEKGFKEGLWELLRPFGERIQGRVSVRDSTGISRPVDDFAIRFTKFGANVVPPETNASGLRSTSEATTQGLNNRSQASTPQDRKLLSNVETLVEKHLTYAEDSYADGPHLGVVSRQGLEVEAASPYYALYLRRLLSGLPIVPHETFAHPVGCIIAISSRNETPVQELQRLYAETNTGDRRLPPWVDSDYLRYYVLIHDEEKDDISRSMSLFDDMKRSFGSHCALLRLRTSQSIETDDDSLPLPRSDWMTAEEELAEIQRSEDDEEFENSTRHIFESDATAIRTFVREMVTQSMVPTMERHISVWNDQVASRRKGLAGTFSNLTKRWAFGSRSTSSNNSSAKDMYDPAGFYWAQSPDAILRKLADYAFMLRDWKLAHSTYEMLHSGYTTAKAWKYQAAANEMTAMSLLLMPQDSSSKSQNRWDKVETVIQEAVYSYGNRCMSPCGALRSMLLPLELLRVRGGPNVDGAGKLGVKLLESSLLSTVGDALLKERLAISYTSREGVGSGHWGNRPRKAGMWSFLAADAWLEQAKYIPAQRCLNQARSIYESLPHKHGISKFAGAQALLDDLQLGLSEKLDESFVAAADSADEVMEEESEALTDVKARRVSALQPPGLLETAPLHAVDGDEDTTVETVQGGFDEQEGGK